MSFWYDGISQQDTRAKNKNANVVLTDKDQGQAIGNNAAKY